MISEVEEGFEKRSFYVKPVWPGMIYLAVVAYILDKVLMFNHGEYFFALYQFLDPVEECMMRSGGRESVHQLWISFISIFEWVVLCVLIYRVWKALAPLAEVRGESKGAGNLISPVLAVVLFLIPLFSLFWCFLILGRLEPLAREYAGLLKQPYRGPSRAVFLSYPVLSLFGVLFVILFYFLFQSPLVTAQEIIGLAPYFSYLEILLNLVILVSFYLCMRGMNKIIQDLGNVELWVKKD